MGRGPGPKPCDEFEISLIYEDVFDIRRMVIDKSNGNLHVLLLSALDDTGSGIYGFSTNKGETWTFRNILEIIPGAVDLDLDKDGTPFILSRPTKTTLQVHSSLDQGATWDKTTTDPSVPEQEEEIGGFTCVIHIDSSNDIHVIYGIETKLYYTILRDTGVGWNQHKLISDDYVENTRPAMKSVNDNARIAFATREILGTTELRYASTATDGDSWTFNKVFDFQANSCELIIDSNNQPHIIPSDATGEDDDNSYYIYSEDNGINWVIKEIPIMNSNYLGVVSFDLDAYNNPHAVYRTLTDPDNNTQVNYTYSIDKGITWDTRFLDKTGRGGGGVSFSAIYQQLVMDDNSVRICYISFLPPKPLPDNRGNIYFASCDQ